MDGFSGDLFDRGDQFDVLPISGRHRIQIGELILNDALGCLSGSCVPEPDLDGLAVAGNTAVAHVLFTQDGANVAGQRLCPLGERCLHVDLQHEVHTTAQIQS